MATPGITENMGLYTQHPPKRPRASQPFPPRVEPESDHAQNSPSQQQNSHAHHGGAVTPHRNRIPSSAQFQQYAQQEGIDSFTRIGGLSRGASQAISAYQQFEHLEKKEEITQMLGLDVYV